MPRAKTDPRVTELAKRGAEAQLNDLLHEIDMLLELFPQLKDSFDPDELPVNFLLRRGADRNARKPARAVKKKRR
jgi:hypothetical protein